MREIPSPDSETALRNDKGKWNISKKCGMAPSSPTYDIIGAAALLAGPSGAGILAQHEKGKTAAFGAG